MRVLLTSAGGRGHSDPLVPIARAAKEAGHSVAFCCRPPMAEVIEAEGFPAFTAGPVIAVPAAMTPLLPIDRDRELRVLRDGFAGPGIARPRAAALRELCEAWVPDVLVCDETDFGALVAAERLDIPYATVVVSAAGSFLDVDVISEPVNALRAEHGLAPDPQLEMPARYLGFLPGPPSFRDPRYPVAPTVHAVRPAVLEPSPDDAATALVAGDSGSVAVYCTLGTVFNLESGDLFERVLAGVRELEVDVIATVGAIDPVVFGAQPPNVRIERLLPPASVLPVASAVVSHGGSGTVFGTLAYGLPSVLLPMGADQPFNADRCVALGVARVLDAVTCTPDDVRDGVAAVLAEPSYRARARSLEHECRALPDSAYAVALLERLATDRRPIARGIV